MILPSINELTFEEARAHIEQVSPFVEWVHVDVQDGEFIERLTWNEPSDIKGVSFDVKMEAHLMIQEPELHVAEWAAAGMNRLIAHIEALDNPQEFIDACTAHDVEAGLALNPDTSLDAIIPWVKKVDMILFLSVYPGPSGQDFIEDVLFSINALRQQFPNATIEIDGGIVPDTARRSKEAGVDMFVSGSYIFGSDDMQEAIQALDKATL